MRSSSRSRKSCPGVHVGGTMSGSMPSDLPVVSFAHLLMQVDLGLLEAPSRGLRDMPFLLGRFVLAPFFRVGLDRIGESHLVPLMGIKRPAPRAAAAGGARPAAPGAPAGRMPAASPGGPGWAGWGGGLPNCPKESVILVKPPAGTSLLLSRRRSIRCTKGAAGDGTCEELQHPEGPGA